MTTQKTLAAMMLLLATPAAAGDWLYKTIPTASSWRQGAIVVYEPGRPDGIRLAFKCMPHKEPHILLGTTLSIYQGTEYRHRVMIRIVGHNEEYRFDMRKIGEEGQPSDYFYSGVEAEVHKLWFASRKAVVYGVYQHDRHPLSISAILSALRDDRHEAEIHIGRKIAKISLRGAANAVEKFTRHCPLREE